MKKAESFAETAKIAKKGVFSSNPVVIRLLGLAPVLAVTTSLKNGLLLAFATFIVLILMGLFSSLLYARLPSVLRPALLTLAAAAFLTPLLMLSSRYFPNITASVGIFLPLVAVNGIILYRAEHFDSRHGVLPALADGAANGAGYALVVILFSALREMIGKGTLYDKALPGLAGFSFNFALLPPGALILFAVLLAAVQNLRLRRASAWVKGSRNRAPETRR